MKKLFHKKYFVVAKATWDEFSTYRLNFALWRVRMVVQFLAQYYLWFALIPVGTHIGVYNNQLILTYTILTFLLASVVLSTRSYVIGEEINNGNLSNFLIRPINYFLYWLYKDLGDKAMNVILSSVELVILFVLLKPNIFVQTNVFSIFFFLIATVSATGIYFLINVLFGSTGFWTNDAWAPRFLLAVTIGFFSGGVFPLDMLSGNLFLFFSLSPFGSLMYFPIKVYLGQLSALELVTGFVVSIGWNILLYLLLQFIWGKGLRLYTSAGK